jgi:hypothetical protein
MANFSIALAALLIQERTAYKAVIQFWLNFTTLAKEGGGASHLDMPEIKQAVDSLFENIGFQLLAEIMFGVAGHIPRSYLYLASDLLLRLIQQYQNQARLWLKDILGLNSGISPRQQSLFVTCHFQNKLKAATRETFLKKAMTTRNVRRFKDVINEFAAQSRGIIE